MGAWICIIQSTHLKHFSLEGRKSMMTEEAPMVGASLSLVTVSHSELVDCFSPGSLAMG